MVVIFINKKIVLILSITSLCILTFFTLNRNINNNTSDDKDENKEVARGVEIVKEMESKDVSESEDRIEAIQITLNQNNFNKSNEINLVDKFSNSVILGDSRAESLLVYKILDGSSVVASKGKNLITAQKNGDIDKAINLSPKNIFLTYGINDIGIYGESKKFIIEYEEIIKYIHDQLPNTKIYVNSIFDVQDKALLKQPYLSKISDFNKSISNMCDNLGVTYIDASGIVESSLFEGDGIHFKPEFNKRWLKLLISEADL